MPKNTFIMMSLEDNRAKEIANAVGSKTCKKILDYLSKVEDASETKISKELEIALSTVHYNIKLLQKQGLVESKEFKWSPKGKKVDLYKVAQKLIIIAPKGSEGVLEKLKGFLPVTILLVIGAGIIGFGSKLFGSFSSVGEIAQSKAMFGAEESLMMDAAPRAAMEATPQTIGFMSGYPGVWFLLGGLFVTLLLLIYKIWRKRK